MIKIVCMKLFIAILSNAFLMVRIFNFLKMNLSTLLTSLMVKKLLKTLVTYLYMELHIVLCVISHRHSFKTFFYSLSSQKNILIPLFIIKNHILTPPRIISKYISKRGYDKRNQSIYIQ